MPYVLHYIGGESTRGYVCHFKPTKESIGADQVDLTSQLEDVCHELLKGVIGGVRMRGSGCCEGVLALQALHMARC